MSHLLTPVFSVKHIRRHLWFSQRVKMKAESLSSSCTATSHFPWQQILGRVQISLFSLISYFSSRLKFYVLPAVTLSEQLLWLFLADTDTFCYVTEFNIWGQTYALYLSSVTSLRLVPHSSSYSLLFTLILPTFPLPLSLCLILTPDLNLFSHRGQSGFSYWRGC